MYLLQFQISKAQADPINPRLARKLPHEYFSADLQDTFKEIWGDHEYFVADMATKHQAH